MLKDRTDWSDEPAVNPNLRLFQARSGKDLLVVYDERSERTGSIRSRAYFLHKNQQRIELGDRPHFVKLRSTNNLPAVLVFQTPPDAGANFSKPPYAVVSTNTESFTVYSGGSVTNSYDLPIYGDPFGKAERIILSPVAIAVDVTLVAAVIYFGALDSPCLNR